MGNSWRREKWKLEKTKKILKKENNLFLDDKKCVDIYK